MSVNENLSYDMIVKLVENNPSMHALVTRVVANTLKNSAGKTA